MKPIYRKVKVEYDGHREAYIVYTKKWFWWYCYQVLHFDKDDSNRHFHYRNKTEAEQRAIQIAEGLLESKVIFEKARLL